ncbi:hypothetical protein MHD_05665 [Mannheimia granulomatis]|uniref:Membrane protein n=1 Tax=Mannheimia granulomatis TaxID=85402 RepID=A0A011P547_9PAST|nr:porin [Mannheimia granulomatis]EXI61634.1 membrane protein [Mannheimia granulomatis]RGE48578.1 hypothetical protein MHD_05665 [Mannheimia granulomatis]
MKKTLVALAVTAFAASAAAKIDLYSQDGTTVSTDGRVKVVAHKETTKVNRDKTKYGHSALSNDGTRLGLTVNHNITEDFYALGRLEIRFDGGDKKGSDNWGNAYAKRAFVGLGHKQYGQVTFGKQLLVGDDVGRIGLDNYYNVGSSYAPVGGWTILNESSDSAVRYDYKGVQGLTLSADYSFANKHDTVGSDKAGYGAGAIYEFAAGEGTASVSLGYAHKDIESGSKVKRDQDGVFGGFNYVVNGVKLGVDGGYSVRKSGDAKDKLNYVRTGLRYDIQDTKTGVYGNYSYLVVKSGQEKDKAHQFLLGADYSFHKHAKVFVEGKLAKARFDDKSKQTDKGIAAGLIVFW